jgi:hypothetical protein
VFASSAALAAIGEVPGRAVADGSLEDRLMDAPERRPGDVRLLYRLAARRV